MKAPHTKEVAEYKMMAQDTAQPSQIPYLPTTKAIPKFWAI